GPALLFQNIRGHRNSQLLINQFGSERRMRLALGVDSLDEIADRIRAFMDVKSPQGFLDKVKMLPMLAEMGKFFPKTVTTAACKEVIRRDQFSLLDFPILQCWPKDAGRFITLPCVITRDPKTGKRNVGMYRMQVFDERTTGMHWQRQKVAAEHYRESLRAAATNAGAPPLPGRGKGGSSAAVDIMARTSGGSILPEGPLPTGKMEVAVAIGTDPALTFCAIVPAPPDVEEFLIAGFLRQKPVELVKCETIDLEVPADADTILELVDINLPLEGVFHNLMIVSIRKSYPGQACKVMNAIWSLGQAMFTKCILVVDEDVNVQDLGEVTLKVLNNIDPERDIQFTLGPIDSLDHSSRLPNYGSKMGVDATRKWSTEGFARPWPDEITMDAKTKSLVDSKWKALAKE